MILPLFYLAALLKDIPKLKAILTYHVVADSVRPTRNGRSYDTVNGKEISVKVTVDTVQVSISSDQQPSPFIICWSLEKDYSCYLHTICKTWLPHYYTTKSKRS